MKPRYIINCHNHTFYAYVRQITDVWFFDICTTHFPTALNRISQLLHDGYTPDLYNFRLFLQDLYFLNNNHSQ